MPSTHNMEHYIPVTYPTGLLWNPYPTMLGKFDMWPQNFPPELKSVKQEVLNKEMERVPATSIGVVQSLPAPDPQYKQVASTHPPLVALGLKTFAPLTDSTTLFRKPALWALLFPDHQSPAFFRGLLVQPLLWRLGLHIAFSFNKSSLQGNSDVSSSEDNVDLELMKDLQQTNLTDCFSVVSCLTHIYSTHNKADLEHLGAWFSDLDKIGYEAPRPRPHRKFAYLTQGAALSPTSNPRLNTALKSSSFDTFYLSFTNNGSGDLFFPKSTFQQGRNALLRLALAMEVSPGYEYFVFTDEDIRLENVNDPSHSWKTNMSTDPWVRLEVLVTISLFLHFYCHCIGFTINYEIFTQEFLLKFAPAVGFGRYDNWVQTKNNSGIYSITTTHDQCLGAYSR